MLRFKICNLYTSFSGFFSLPHVRCQSRMPLLSSHLVSSRKKSDQNECDPPDRDCKIPRRMEVLEFDSKKKELCLLEVPVPPKLSDHDVLVKVAYAGICGSDLKMLSGDIPVADKIILGHEICGTVAETGKEVDSVIPGDRVAIDPNSGCGVCPECADGNYHYCECGGGNNYVGVFRNGGWAEYCVVPARQAFLIPKNMAFELAALTEPLSCISHGWDKIQPLQIGKRILILGAGIAGNLYACLFHLNGHRKVTVCEPQEGRRKIFDDIDTGFEIITPNQLKERKAKCPNWKVDVVVDCSGNVNALEDAVELLNNGGLLSIYGLAPPQAKFRVSPFLLFEKELTINSVLLNPFCFRKSMKYIAALNFRYLGFEKLGVQVFKLKDFEEAIRALKSGCISKAIFKMI